METHADMLRDKGIDPELIRIVTTQPVTKDEFKQFVEVALGYRFKAGGIHMAEQALTDGHMVPLDWMYELYCLGSAVLEDGSPMSEEALSRAVKEILLHGPRGGMKTLAFAAMWFIFCWFLAGYSVTHSATETSQARACELYLRMWSKFTIFEDGIDKVNRYGMTFHNGSRFALRTATINGLNSEHTISISLDEVETMEPDLLNQALQIQQGEVGCRWPSLVILASTQKKPGLGMSKLIKKALKDGKFNYILWNCWDIAEKCPEWRRENLPDNLCCTKYPKIVAEMNELQDRQTELSPADLSRLDTVQRWHEQLTTNCPLCIDCHGKLLDGTGHLPIDTLCQRILNLDRPTWVAENLCAGVSRSGAVYDYLSAANKSEEAIYREGQRVVAGVDYGFINDPSIAVFLGLYEGSVDVFDEYEGENMYEEDLIPIFLKYQKRYRVSKWIVDNSAIKLYQLMRKAGLPAVRSSRQGVEKGCDHVARLICDGTGYRRLRFHPMNAYSTYEQMEAYVKAKGSNKPKLDQLDDYCDATRYACEDVEVRTGTRARLLRRGRKPGRSLGRRR